jgi:hypothetical protein
MMDVGVKARSKFDVIIIVISPPPFFVDFIFGAVL